MNRSRRNPVWFVLAWAAVVAQAAPLSLCRDCSRPCCAAHEAAAGDAAAGEVATCPACAAAEATVCAAAGGLETASGGQPARDPCRCQLDARPEQPLAVARANPPRAIGGDAAIVAPAALPPAPPALGASREYLAATLAIPIRPPRILYGVWRN